MNQAPPRSPGRLLSVGDACSVRAFFTVKGDLPLVSRRPRRSSCPQGSRSTPLWDTAAAAAVPCSRRKRTIPLTRWTSWPISQNTMGTANRAPVIRGPPLWWANHRQRHISPTNDLGQLAAHYPALRAQAPRVRRLRTASDGWNCCCNCCSHGEEHRRHRP